MTGRPYTVVSCCISLDGFLDDAGRRRLLLSNPADLDRVDRVRAGSDAILVGAGTVRQDDPRLVVRSSVLRAERRAAGMPESPAKVTVTSTGDLDPRARFFTAGASERLVYCASPAAARLRSRIGPAATVVDAGGRPALGAVLDDLAGRGVERLMVEGGRDVLTQLLAGGLADELQLAVAPVFVGDARSPRFVGDGRFPWSGGRRAALVETRSVGDVALLRYALTERAGLRIPQATERRQVVP